MKTPTEQELELIIESATRKALAELFSRGERFYYFALITTGEALPPIISAWSHESFQRYLKLNNISKNDGKLMAFSYAESPYLDFGSDYFSTVKEAFKLRPTMSHTMSNAEWVAEYQIRLTAMEKALRRLDEDNAFSVTQNRNSILINVEVVPPDQENTQRAFRLNPVEALTVWLSSMKEL